MNPVNQNYFLSFVEIADSLKGNNAGLVKELMMDRMHIYHSMSSYRSCLSCQKLSMKSNAEPIPSTGEVAGLSAVALAKEEGRGGPGELGLTQRHFRCFSRMFLWIKRMDIFCHLKREIKGQTSCGFSGKLVGSRHRTGGRCGTRTNC